MGASSIVEKAIDFAERPAASVPPAGISISWLGGIDINLLISILTATYLVLQITLLLWKNSAGLRAWIRKRMRR